MPAADPDRDAQVELTYAQAAELYARAEARAALLRAAAAPTTPARGRRWRTRLAVPVVGFAALLVGIAFWAHGASSSPNGSQSFDALAMGPTIARPQPSVGRIGTVAELSPALGFRVLLPHTRLANPRLLSSAWSGELGSAMQGVAATDGIVLDFTSGLRVIELPASTAASKSGSAPGGLTMRTAVVDGLVVRAVALSDPHSPADLDAVLRSLR